MEKFEFIWIIGDPYDDGHGMYDKRIVEVNTNNSSDVINYLKNDFEKECREILYLDIESWFRRYEENTLSEENVATLKKLGYKFDDSFDREYVTPYEFFCIWLFLLNYLMPNLEAKEVNLDVIEPTGGYGLFRN